MREQSMRERSSWASTRWVAWLLGVAITIGVLGWMIVDLWLLETSPSSPHVATIGGPSPANLNTPPARADSDMRDQNRQGSSTNRVDPNPSQVKLPLKWLSHPPRPFPTGGVAAKLKHTQTGSSADATLFYQHVVIGRPLDDGIYFWQSGDLLDFPTFDQLHIRVSGEAIEPWFSTGSDAPEFVSVYWLIPVRLTLDSPQETELAVDICAVSGTGLVSDGSFRKRVVVRRMSEIECTVPLMPLEFVDIATMGQSDTTRRRIEASIGNEPPAPGESITLRVAARTKLTIEFSQESHQQFLIVASEMLQVPLDGVDDSALRDLVVAVEIANWITPIRKQRVTANWLDGLTIAGVGGVRRALVLELPTLETQAVVRVAVYVTSSRGTALEQRAQTNVLLAVGERDCEPGRGSYAITASVLRNDVTLSVRVTDTQDRPIRDFPVEVQPLFRSVEGRPQTIGRQLVELTDISGLATFSRLQGGPGIGVRIKPGVPLRPTLNGGFSPEQWFDGVKKVAEVRIFVEVGSPVPVAFAFDLSALGLPVVDQSEATTPTGVRRAIAVPHAVVPQRQNRNFAGDITTSGSLDRAGRLVTSIRTEGDYVAVLRAPWGEKCITFRHAGAGAIDVPVAILKPESVKARCVDSAGAPLEGAMVFTSGLAAQLAWAIAKSEEAARSGFMSMQTTNVEGRCEFPCQPDNLNPRAWWCYHKSCGLVAASAVDGSASTGLQLVVEPAQRPASLSITVNPPANESAAQLTVCISPVFCATGDDVIGLFAHLGVSRFVANSPVQIGPLPPGEYAVSVIRTSPGSGHKALGNGFTKVVRVAASTNAELVLPAP